MEKTFSQKFSRALCHVGYTLLYFLILLPANIWKRSVMDLSIARDNNALKYDKINSPWPFLSFIKRVFFDFLFDFFVFITPLVGFIAAIVAAVEEKSFIAFLLALIATYYVIPAWVVVKDIIQLTLIAPFRKYLSWIKKPAQHVDLTMDKEK